LKIIEKKLQNQYNVLIVNGGMNLEKLVFVVNIKKAN